MLDRVLTKQVLEGIRYQPVVAILGPRQVGKTTLVKQIAPKLDKKSVYFDLEKSTDLAKFQADRIQFLEYYKEYTVILDEIQRLPELFPDLRALIDEYRVPGRFIVLGSASFKILKNPSESLTGRIAYYELTPLLLEEIPSEDFLNHWLFGGFPASYLSHSNHQRQKWFEDFTRSYIERDLPLYGLSAEPIQVRRLLQMLAGLQGNLLNQSMLANSLGIKIYKLNQWLDFFEHSFFIRRLQPYFTNIKKRLTKSPKLYLRDSGLTHYLLSIHQYDTLMGHAVVGGSWEGYVIEQIIATLQYNQLPFFYRNC